MKRGNGGLVEAKKGERKTEKRREEKRVREGERRGVTFLATYI